MKLTGRSLTVLRRGRAVLDAVDLDMPAGRVTGIIGANGAGKTTLLRLLAGLARPDRGTVSLDGAPLAILTAMDRAARIAFLPQDFQSAWGLSVRQLLELGASRGQPAGWWRPGIAGDVDLEATIRRFDLGALLDRRLDSLSGGERARAAFAGTVARTPELLLADEPAASLDPAQQLQLMVHIRAMAPATTSVVVLHDLNIAARFMDDLLLLDSGRVTAHGPALEVLTSPALDAAFGIAFRRIETDQGLLLVAG